MNATDSRTSPLDSPVLWAVFFLVGAAAVVRQYLFANSYWYDEAFLILAIRERGFAELLGPQPYNLVIPPIDLWLVRAMYLLTGDGEKSLRFPAFVAGLAALAVMIPLAKRFVPRTFAIWPFAWLAVSRHWLSHSCEVRPYTFDLLFTELILLATVVLLDESATSKRWAGIGLGLLAVLGPWTSFPSAFVLGGASVALALQWNQSRDRQGAALWLGFNSLVALSGFAMWWVSARHMYYPGMIEHWGHRGWGGFPDWQSPLGIVKWLLWRSCETGNYGNRELGIVFSLLAVGGAIVLANRRSRVAVLVVPFILAVGAALVGKYPLAHRTTFFLLPCLWLLAANGFAALAINARRHLWLVLAFGVAMVAWDLVWQVGRIVKPDENLDYRGAYEYVHRHRREGDALWAQTAVVYQTYYGKDAPVYGDDDLTAVERLVGKQRVWAVFGSNRHDLRARFQSAGGKIVDEHVVSGLAVVLFE